MRMLDDLKNSLSSVRLESYRRPGDSDLEVVVTYFWNIGLAESLHPSLQAAEVALRNALHDTISKRHPLGQGSEASWFDNKNYFTDDQLRTLAGIRKQYRKIGTPFPTDDQVVSSTSMGFWTGILSSAAEGRLWQRLGFNMLWEMFPQAPRRSRVSRGLALGDYHERFDEIRTLRNRVSHYEQICNHPDLIAAHGRIYEAIGWIDPRLATIVAATDSFNKIHSLGRGFYREKVNALLDD